MKRMKSTRTIDNLIDYEIDRGGDISPSRLARLRLEELRGTS